MIYWFVIYSGKCTSINKTYKNQAERFEREEDARRRKSVYEKYDWITEIYLTKEVKIP